MRRTVVAMLVCTVAFTALPGSALAGGSGDKGVEFGYCTGTAPVWCHFDIAPGTYDVMTVLGGEKAGSTRITTETRRALLAETPTAAGERVLRTFSVDVRTPEGEPTGTPGSRGLDVYFGGSAPRLDSIVVIPSHARQLFLAGDSTVSDQPRAPYSGWGQLITRFFTRGLSVANYAASGESSGSFLSKSALYPTMRSFVDRGDLVLIQFGHNDERTIAEDYRANLAKLVTDVRARGGRPVLVTPIVRRWFTEDGTLNNDVALHVNELGVDLPAQMRALADDKGVPLIDLTALTRTYVEKLGPEASKSLYLSEEKGDNTHTSRYGATRFARLVLDELRAQGLVRAGVIR